MNYRTLIDAIQAIHQEMKGRAVVAVNQALVLRNWVIGAYIVTFEQQGADRAAYGARLLPTLAVDLAARGVPGCSREMLGRMRLFFRNYPQIVSLIRSPAVAKSPATRNALAPIWSPAVTKLNAFRMLVPIRDSVDGVYEIQESDTKGVTPLQSETVLRFSWTHLQEFVRLADPVKRAFYENECLRGNWSKRQLQRQIESLLYERTGLSTNKKAVIERGRTQAHKAPTETIDDLIRDPYVLEFTGLAERPEYSETDLETALLNHLQRFLLELGTGFCFEARQFRITMNNKHNRVDLVFYNRRLRCHLLIELKVRAFRHTDAGQMNFYLNWFKANMADRNDNPPVGILLCSDKDHTEVEYATAGMNNKLFISRYLTALPSVAQLKALVESDRARLEKPTIRKKRK
ncbi:MAG: DUF1016 family protein [Deltaproteobacteria bacterium]|nr:DUF1016 family protein [Deltaproteobacteria bacterium]